MRFTIASVGLFALFAAAQDLSSLPPCAVTCALNAIGATGCAATDAKCICTATSFLSGVQSCISTACNATDQAATLQFAVTFCGSAGVSITLPTASATASSAMSTMPASSSAPASTEATMTSSMMMASSSASPAPSAYTGAANLLSQDWAGVVGAAALGVAAML
ncbi:hypothetical protein LTR99_002539 [Exophiala xenobiotica]|uniref:CFEM domain-containing protein n=1 Tax=Vermiconidia calcicola TaxID=1690605 RepID=A0AAV9QFH4_9PEZI|nr:hypothetical protein H2202_000916 [Exophiala xenobiotica]KAK5537190.1 hypothetical protein LTR23_007578 [Chaetothyriales sp. CCFEE 6169]KAK5542124.1 hypothetical protein LTR25_002009 [Vermiconidia calcicola]KAK5195220.1 hypothetical protein LTR92_005350 [Exophiala xenobiotica]KAK5209805.1 hypothetical protein LTR41_004437 [Exophiala xenobiotica]